MNQESCCISIFEKKAFWWALFLIPVILFDIATGPMITTLEFPNNKFTAPYLYKLILYITHNITLLALLFSLHYICKKTSKYHYFIRFMSSLATIIPLYLFASFQSYLVNVYLLGDYNVSYWDLSQILLITFVLFKLGQLSLYMGYYKLIYCGSRKLLPEPIIYEYCCYINNELIYV